jgi:hypothetical protein
MMRRFEDETLEIGHWKLGESDIRMMGFSTFFYRYPGCLAGVSGRDRIWR